jgi:hypothetical protein
VVLGLRAADSRSAVIAIVLIVGVLAAVTDVLAVAWHDARERRAAGRAALIAAGLEAAAWVPVVVAIETGDARVAVAAIVGSAIGCWLAVRRLRARDARS